MPANSTQPETPADFDQLASRVWTLGANLVSLRPDGTLRTSHGECSILPSALTAPAALGAAATAWRELKSGQPPVQVATGIWLAPTCLPDDQDETGQQRHVLLLVDDRVDQQKGLRVIDRDDVARIASIANWLCENSQTTARQAGEIDSLTRQLGATYEELHLLYTLSNQMTVAGSADQFLSTACDELREVTELTWTALLVTDSDEPNEISGRTIITGQLPDGVKVINGARAALFELISTTLDAQIVEDVAGLGQPSLTPLGQSLLVVPVAREGALLGVLVAADKTDGEALSSVEAKLFHSMAGSLAIYLENTTLYADLQAMFVGTLQALSASIDAKDRYTRGHSERVALLARQLAEAAGLDPAAAERVYLSGLLHDVGKIGVPESVLCKPGKLTNAEFEQIKRHPTIGAHIIADIRKMNDLIPGVLYHHERWDGRGYPEGLSGDAIPLYGRLICLADSFDAMRSDRTYRAAMSHTQTINEIVENTGSQFDPELTPLFVNLSFDAFYNMLRTHQVNHTFPGAAA